MYKAYRNDDCDVDLATALSFTTFGAAPALAGSDVTDDTATLTLTNWRDDWWYKYTTPSGDTSCTKVTGSSSGTTTKALTGLDASTAYVYKAYRNSGCSTDLATAAQFTTFAAAPALAGSDVTNSTATLTLSNWKEDWWFKYTTPSGDTSCTKVTGDSSGTTTKALTGLDSNKSYVYRAYRDSGCGTHLATASSFRTFGSAPALAGSDVTNSTATLTLSNWREDWWFKYTTPSGDTSCTKVTGSSGGTTTAAVSGLDASTSYVYKAYRNSGCSVDLATASSFTTFGAAPSLVGSDVTNTTATLTLSNWAEDWWFKYTTGSGSNSCTKVTGHSSGTTTKALTGRTASTAYVYEAYRNSGCSTDLATAPEFTTYASAPALAASQVTNTTATLTLSNWAEDWWYKYTTPSGDTSCTKVAKGTSTKGLTGLDSNKSYVYRAYRDSGCGTVLATAAQFRTFGAAPALAGSDVTDDTATLTLSNWRDDWWYKYTTPTGDSSCTKVTGKSSGTTTAAVSDLDAGTAYVYKAYRNSGCSTDLATAAQFTTFSAAPALASSDVTNNTATLTLSNWAEDWWFKYTTPSGDTSCTKVTGDSGGVTSADLTGRRASTAYVYEAYRNSGCSVDLATADKFTTYGAAPGLAASEVTNTTAKLTLSNWGEDWWYKYTTPTGDTSCTKVAKGTNTKGLTGLDSNKAYVYEAYRNDECDVDLATASSFTTFGSAPGLAASEVTDETAKLTLSNWGDDWWYKYTTPTGDSSCTKVTGKSGGTTTAAVSGLDASTAYVYQAYRNSGCSVDLATASSFTTQPAAPALAASDVTNTTATLTLSNWDDPWWYKYTSPGGGQCKSVSAGTDTVSLTSLTANRTYVFKAYRKSGCATVLATAPSFRTYASAPALAASDVTNTTATLTLSNWAEDWWYKYTTPSGDTSCTKVTGESDGETSEGLTGRTASTAYVYKAYRNSSCSTDLATAPQFTTFGAAPALAGSHWTDDTATLTLSNWAEDWWYRYTTPTGDTSCTKVPGKSGGTTTTKVSGLDAGTAYVYKAYRNSGCTTDLATADEFTTFASPPELSTRGVIYNQAILVLANWGEDWWYKYTTPSGDTSCTKVTKGTYTVQLTGLTPNTTYVYKAYRESGCSGFDLTDTAPAFRTPRAPILATSEVTNTTATLTLSHWDADWWYQYTSPSGGTCESVSAGTGTVSLTTLTAEETYIFQAYRDSGCSTDLATAPEFTTYASAPALTPSNVTWNLVTLTISNWGDEWWYKYTAPLDGTCSTVVSGESRRVSLRPNTTYVFKAYRDAVCSVDLASATQFGTPSAPQPPQPPGDTPPVQVTPPDYFSDDEGSYFEPYINKLAAAGITKGCAPGLYCPKLPATRAQMASFLTRALSLPAATAAQSRGFGDVAGSVHRDAIYALAAAGITVGCNPEGTAYCPDDPVTRAQMASFLTRALKLPVPAPGDRREFSDVVADDVHRDAIFALAAAGITRGCETTRYCPDDPVTRGQMAAFLVRALKL